MPEECPTPVHGPEPQSLTVWNTWRVTGSTAPGTMTAITSMNSRWAETKGIFRPVARNVCQPRPESLYRVIVLRCHTIIYIYAFGTGTGAHILCRMTLLSRKVKKAFTAWNRGHKFRVNRSGSPGWLDGTDIADSGVNAVPGIIHEATPLMWRFGA